MDMQQAFKIYFCKLEQFSEERYGSRPTISYSEAINKALLLSSPDEDGEVEWAPTLQRETVDWQEIEYQLSFSVCEDLRAFYSTYYFLALEGILDNKTLNLYPIDGSVSISSLVLRHYADAQTFFPGSRCFLIGNAIINDDDSFFIFFDNANQKVFCYEADTKQTVKVAGTIAEIVSTMEARG